MSKGLDLRVNSCLSTCDKLAACQPPQQVVCTPIVNQIYNIINIISSRVIFIMIGTFTFKCAENDLSSKDLTPSLLVTVVVTGDHAVS